MGLGTQRYRFWGGDNSDEQAQLESFAALNLSAADMAFVSGGVVIDAEGSEVASSSGAWGDFTPTWTASTTNPSVGDGTLSGRYIQDGDTVHFRVQLHWGSTTSGGSGEWQFTLPVEHRGGRWVFSAFGHDNATAWRAALNALTISSTAFKVYTADTAAGDALTPSIPHTWANGDDLWIVGTYEAV